MLGMKLDRNIVLQKQTRTSVVSPDEFRGGQVNNAFPYLFVNTPRKPGTFNSPPSILVSNILEDLRDRSLGGSDEFNKHESGDFAFNAALIVTPELYAKYGDRLGTLYGGETAQTTLRQRIEGKNRPRMYIDNLSFAGLAEHEIDEIASYLVVFTGDVKSTQSLEPLFLGTNAVKEIIPMLVEGGRQDEIDSVNNYLSENGRSREIVPVGRGLSIK